MLRVELRKKRAMCGITDTEAQQMCDFGACNLLPGRYFKMGSHDAPEVFAVLLGSSGLSQTGSGPAGLSFRG